MQSRLKPLMILLFGLGLFTSSLLVVYEKHQNRQLFTQLQSLQHETEFLQEEWSRLLLEQGTWASDARIEKLARTQLQMVLPEANKVVILCE
jgi:cell division protein FtsL